MTITWKEIAKRRRTQYEVKDCDGNGFVLQDVIEQFYDIMIERVLNYIGAE